MRELLTVTGRWTRDDAGTCRSFPFEVSARTRRLRVIFWYEPLTAERPEERIQRQRAMALASRRLGRPVSGADFPGERLPGNFATLSLEDPLGYRGTRYRLAGCHRVVLEDAQATPGYELRALAGGLWRATVTVWAMASPQCRYELAAWAEESAGGEVGGWSGS